MVEGQKSFKIDDHLTIGQYDNGMHWAEIRDDNGVIESVLTALTSAELFRKLKEHNIVYN